jgi:hypothetical protein
LTAVNYPGIIGKPTLKELRAWFHADGGEQVVPQAGERQSGMS